MRPLRDALRGWRTELVLAAATAAGARGEHHRAVEVVLPVVAEDELNEPAARALMRALVADGRHAEALAVFERLREAIGHEYGAVPDPRTRRLYRDLLAGGRPPRSTGTRGRQLPRPQGRARTTCPSN